MTQSDKHLEPVPNRVAIVIGGAGLALLPRVDILQATMALAIDVETELAVHDEVFKNNPHVLPLTLGKGHTSHTLYQDAQSATKNYVDSLARMNAHYGFGCGRSNGAKGTDILLGSGPYLAARDVIADTLMNACNGCLRNVEIHTYTGLSGGTGSGGAPIITDDLAIYLADVLDALVEVTFNLVGATNYIGLGRRIPLNAAAAVTEIAALVIKNDDHLRIIRSAQLVEHPLCETNQSRREHLAAIDTQSLACPEVQRQLHMTAPNNSMSGPYGNVDERQPDFHDRLPNDVVVDEVAQDLTDQLGEFFDYLPDDPTCIDNVHIHDTANAVPRCDLRELATQPNRESFDNYVEEVTRPPLEYAYHLTVTLHTGQAIDLDHVQTYWASPPKSPEEARYRLIVLNAILADLESKLEELGLDIEQSEEDYQYVVTRMRRIWNSVTGRRRVLWHTHDVLIEQLIACSQGVRDLSDHLDAARSRHARISEVRDNIECERTFLGDHIKGILGSLSAHKLTVVAEDHPSYVKARPVVDLWDRLWTFERASFKSQINVLLSAVEHVTVAGLAALVAAEPPRIDTIAHNALFGPFTEEGPPWGGHPRSDCSETIVIFPPIESDVASELKKLIEDPRADVAVAIGETCIAGPAVVRQRYYNVRSAKDLIVGYLARSLRIARHCEEASLYFPNGYDSLDELGIDVDPDSIRFRDPK